MKWIDLGSALAREKGYSFSPIEAASSKLIDQPIRVLTRKFLNREQEPSLLARISIGIVASIAASIGFEKLYLSARLEKTQQQIGENAEAFDALIENDFRYRSIKRDLASGEISQAEARHQAYLVSLGLSSYFEHRRSSMGTGALEDEVKLINHLVFFHLRSVFESGVSKDFEKDGFLVPDASVGKLNDAQKLELFRINHQMQVQFQMAVELVNQSRLWQELQTSGRVLETAHAIESSPVATEAMTRVRRGELSRGRALSAIQEDIYWQTRFKEWSIIGVARLERDHKGTYSGQPLTINKVRAEILADL